jgi:hypothetical protein
VSYTVVISIPSRSGIDPHTVQWLWNLAWELFQKKMGGALLTVKRMPLDSGRNLLGTAFVANTTAKCKYNLLLDDDCWMESPAHLFAMLECMEAEGGPAVLSAPCRLRNHSGEAVEAFGAYNIRPKAMDPIVIGKQRVLACDWTGLGAVLVRRDVMGQLYEKCDKYAFEGMPGTKVSAIFRSLLVPAKRFQADAPEDLNVYLLDDRAFSVHLGDLGIPIHAAIDVVTFHDGMRGCFGQEIDRFKDRPPEPKHEEPEPPKLLGPDGRPAKP